MTFKDGIPIIQVTFEYFIVTAKANFIKTSDEEKSGAKTISEKAALF